jgi:hypothetical protein
MGSILVTTIIFNIVIIAIELFLAILYIKSNSFSNFPCYNVITLSVIICFDNLLRVLPFEIFYFRYAQAFLLVFLDKLILTNITIYPVLVYLGLINEVYNQKYIFIKLTFASCLINLAISSIYISYGKIDHEMYSYCSESSIKKIIDISFNTIFLFICLLCFIKTSLVLSGYKRRVTLGNIEDLGYNHFFNRNLCLFIINSLFFSLSYLIIIYGLKKFYIDLFYLPMCLILDLSYSINEKVISEASDCFCRRKENLEASSTTLYEELNN